MGTRRNKRKNDSDDDDNDDDDDDDDDGGFSRGDRVEAKVSGWTKHYPGEITRAHSNGTYDLKFDDGERKSSVKKSQIRSLNKGKKSSSSTRRNKRKNDSDDDDGDDDDDDDGGFSRGDRVEAKVSGWTKHYPGEITRAHS